jgi:hypothetical protein
MYVQPPFANGDAHLRNVTFSKRCPFFLKVFPTLLKLQDATLAFINLKGISRIVDPFNMGGTFSKMMSKLFANREMRILMLGLDAAGKTSTNSPIPPTFL